MANWAEHDEGLVRRGDFTLWLSPVACTGPATLGALSRDAFELPASELTLILDGIDLRGVQRGLSHNEAERTEKNAALTIENKALREENAILRKGLFGRRSERLEPGQLGIFAAEAELAAAEPPAPVEREPESKPGHGRAPSGPNLPRETIELDVAEVDRVCDCRGKPLQRIGEEVTERGRCGSSRGRRFAGRPGAASRGPGPRGRPNPDSSGDRPRELGKSSTAGRLAR